MKPGYSGNVGFGLNSYYLIQTLLVVLRSWVRFLTLAFMFSQGNRIIYPVYSCEHFMHVTRNELRYCRLYGGHSSLIGINTSTLIIKGKWRDGWMVKGGL